MMFFTLNIMENIRYFNTKFSHFNYIFKIIQYILYYCRILYLPPRRWHVGSWWMVEGVPLLLSSLPHLQVQVSSSSSSLWAPADGIAVVCWHLQLQVGLPSLVIVTGNPGVSQGYPYPTRQKPVPAPRVRVFAG